MSLDARALWNALQRLPYRSAQLLSRRFAEGRTPAELCALYGISPEALEIHLVRALRLLDLSTRVRTDVVLPEDAAPLPAGVEIVLGRELAREAPTGEESVRLLTLARALRTHGEALHALDVEAARRALDSPKARREDLLRRIALLALIVLAVWMYLRNGR